MIPRLWNAILFFMCLYITLIGEYDGAKKILTFEVAVWSKYVGNFENFKVCFLLMNMNFFNLFWLVDSIFNVHE